MKKFISALLAVTMLFAFCGVAAFAADTTVITLGLAKTPTVEGAVSDPSNIQVDDVFEVAVKFTDIQGETFTSAQVIVKWDPTKVQPVDSTGKAITDNRAKKQAVNPNLEILPDKDEFDGTIFNWFDQTSLDIAKGELNLTATLSPEYEFAKTGHPLNGVKEFEFFTLRFKALEAGDTGIAITKQILFLGTAEAPLTLAPVDIVVKGDGPVVTDKVITGITVTDVPSEVEVGAPVELPATAKATIKDSTQTVEVPVTWDPETIDTAEAGIKTATATAKDVDGYTYENDAARTTTVTVTVKESQVEPPVKNEITSVTNPDPVTVKIGDTVTLPETVKGQAGETEVDVNVAWETVDTSAVGQKTVTGTLTAPEGYTIADGLTATAIVNVIDDTPTESDLPLEAVTEVNPDSAGGLTIKVTVSENANDSGRVTYSDDEQIAIVVTYIAADGKTPLQVTAKTEPAKNAIGQSVALSQQPPQGAAFAKISVVKGLDWDKPIDENNIGIALALTPDVAI